MVHCHGSSSPTMAASSSNSSALSAFTVEATETVEAGLARRREAGQRRSEAARAAHGVVTALEPVEAHLHLVHLQAAMRSAAVSSAPFVSSTARTSYDGSSLVELPEVRVLERLAAREQEAQTAAGLELLEHATEPEDRQVVGPCLAVQAVPAAEVAAPGEMHEQVAQRGQLDARLTGPTLACRRA